MNILLVDDDPASLMALGEVLAPLQETVVQARSGHDALRELLERRFALILLDVRMPGLDGYELAALIRGHDAHRHTPIIFITGSERARLAEFEGYHAGAVDYLHKPVEPEALRAKVSAFVAMARWTQHLEEEVASSCRVQQLLHSAHAAAETQLAQERSMSGHREAFLRAVLESLTDAVVACDASGSSLLFNAAARRLHGAGVQPMSIDEWASRLSLYRSDGVTPLPTAEVPLLRVLRGETIRDIELVVAPPNGSPRWLLASGRSMVDDSKQTVGAVVAMHDITERRNAEAALRESQALFRDFMDHTSALAFIRDEAGALQYANQAYERFFGQSLTELKGAALTALLPAETADRIRLLYNQVLLDGQPMRVRETIPDPEGRPHLLEFSLFRIAGPTGEWFVGGVALDVSEQSLLEEQLRQSQKMEALGLLAGGIAHDFNNVLAVINGYSDLLLLQQDLGTTARSYVGELRKAGERAAGLTRQLLAMSRRQILNPRLLDLNGIIHEMSGMLRRLIGEDITIAITADPHPGMVRADPGQIEQVLLNLAVNARDAMPSGGRLTIETRTLQVDPGPVSQHPGLEPGSYVVLALSDTGHGMEPEVQQRIFEPFFTTKEAGRGTGLGLATVFGIVKQSGGHITVHSEPERGTSFSIYLPQVNDAENPGGKESRGVPCASSSASILVVEDDPQLRSLIVRMLHDCGHRVVPAESGADALSVLAARSGKVDLVLSDVVMPAMGGRELAEQIRRRWPTVKILFMSGHTDDEVMRRGVLTAEMDFISKPFQLAELTRSVQEVLGRDPAP